MNRIRKFLCVFLAASFLSGCAGSGDLQTTHGGDASDPLEPYNRVMFGINRFFDRVLIKPIAEGYRAITPPGFRMAMRNVFANIGEPVNAVNNILQGNVARAGNNIFRFIVNTTYGIAGLNDVANDFDLEPDDQDFGITLAKWGVGEGPYVVLPLVGGYNLRDATGIAGDYFAGPLTWLLWNEDYTWLYLSIPKGIIAREKYLDLLDGLEKDAVDFYSAMRETLRQNRRAVVNRSLGITDNATQYDFNMDFDEE